MQKELIDKANEIIGMIEKNERAVSVLEQYADKGGAFYFGSFEYDCLQQTFSGPSSIDFEDWEIRLMIHNKKERIKALKAQLERL